MSYIYKKNIIDMTNNNFEMYYKNSDVKLVPNSDKVLKELTITTLDKPGVVITNIIGYENTENTDNNNNKGSNLEFYDEGKNKALQFVLTNDYTYSYDCNTKEAYNLNTDQHITNFDDILNASNSFYFEDPTTYSIPDPDPPEKI